MYAVYVLAAILLSVAPMHATTVLAAIPSVARGQRASSARLVRGERSACHSGQISPPAGLSAAHRATVETAATSQQPHATKWVQAASHVDANLLVHSPHAP